MCQLYNNEAVRSLLYFKIKGKFFIIDKIINVFYAYEVHIHMTNAANTTIPELKRSPMDKILCYTAMAFYILLPIVEIITEVLKSTKIKTFRFMYPSYFQPYVVGLFGIIGTALVIATFVLRIVRKNFKLYVADVFYFTLLIFMLLSMIFSVNPGVFADGSPFYCEHPLHFLCYYFLFFAGSMIEDSELRKKLLASYFIVALMQGIVAFLQTYKIEIAYCLYFNNRVSKTSAYGLLQNTNFYGTLSCLLTAACAGLFIFSSVIFKKKFFRTYFKWFIFATTLLVFYTMLASNARLAWLGFAAMILTYIISLIAMRKSNMDKETLKKITIDFAIMLAGFIVIVAVTTLFTNYIVGRIKETAKDTVARVGEDGFGHGRGRIWRAALHSVPRHWVTGIGLDNLTQAFREMPGWTKGDYVQAKGHNEYIHMLATQGVFAITNYVLLLLYAVVTTVKRIFTEKDDVKRCLCWLFLTMFAAYVSQAMLSSSIMNVAPYFWIILGLSTQRIKPISFKKK